MTKNDTKKLYSKEQLISSKKYRKFRDFLNGNLDEDKSYSTDEVDKMIKKFYGKKVDE